MQGALYVHINGLVFGKIVTIINVAIILEHI